MRGTYWYDESSCSSTSSDDNTNAAVNIEEYGNVFEAVDVSRNTITGHRYQRTEPLNEERTTKNSPLFISIFKISFTLLVLSVILLIAVFFFYPDQLGFSGAANANQSNDNVPILIIKDSSTQSPSMSPLESGFEHETSKPTPKASRQPRKTEAPTKTTIRQPIPINIPKINSTPAPTLSPMSPPSTSPTLLPTTLPPTRFPTTLRPTSAPTRTSITFYVLGDIPYDYDEELILSEQILGLPDDAEFVFHVGDIMRPKRTYCMDSAYARVKEILLQSKVPVFITLGDNDWIDCPDQNIALAYWKNNFHKFDRNWNHNFPISRQSTRKENVAWLQEKILFMSVHIVGGSIYDSTEWYSRLNDDVSWVNKNIERYRHRLNVIIIFGHANPSNNLGTFFEELARISNELGKPMLYIHGDGHSYYMRRVPFYDAEHIVDVQVDQGKNAPPLKVIVRNDATDPHDVFEFDRRISSS